MIKHNQHDVQPAPHEVLEISRRIKSGQRPIFKFTNNLVQLFTRKELEFVASPEDVRVNLISRYDNINPSDIPKLATLGSVAISDTLGIKTTSSCDKYSTMSLKPAVLSDKGDGWRAVELPIEESDYPFDEEREALKGQIDKAFGEEGSIWYPETPALQVVEFKADTTISQAILEYVATQAPLQTEVFEASVRFRSPPV